MVPCETFGHLGCWNCGGKVCTSPDSSFTPAEHAQDLPMAHSGLGSRFLIDWGAYFDRPTFGPGTGQQGECLCPIVVLTQLSRIRPLLAQFRA